MDFITNILSSVAIITVILGVIAKLIPNEKLRGVGLSVGTAITSFGSGKLGKAAWEQIENFFVNSFGVFFEGLKVGLNSDDEEE